MVGATGKLQAEVIQDVLEEYQSLESLQAVLVDNTAVNTGHSGSHIILICVFLLFITKDLFKTKLKLNAAVPTINASAFKNLIYKSNIDINNINDL